MKPTVVKLVLTIEDGQGTNYIVIRKVSPIELHYLKETYDKALNCMVDALLAYPRKITKV